MMVDDDDVALHRPAVHLGNEAALPRTTFLSQASVGARVELVPKRAGFGQRRQFSPVAVLRGLLPCGNRAVMLDLIQAAEDRRISKIVEFFSAKIIIAAFHVADAQLAFAVRKQRMLEKGNVFIEELLLQILCSCGDDDPFARANPRHQVSQRLASASAGFDNQMPLFPEHLLYGLRHLKLASAEFVCGVGA